MTAPVGSLEFLLPDVGEGLAGAEIVQWLVAPGDMVREDQPVVVVETDKAQVEIPAPTDGTVAELGAEVGVTLPVGAVLLRLAPPVRGTGCQDDHPHTQPPAPDSPTPAPAPAPAPAPEDPHPRRVLASPGTRRLGIELGVDLTAVTGTGPGGRVLPEDIRAAAAAPILAVPVVAAPTATAAPVPAAPAPRAGEVVPLRGLRRQVARAMTAAWQVPHITEFREVDATELVRARRALGARLATDGVKVTYLPLLLLATIAALRAHPTFNARLDLDREEIHLHGAVHLGLAAATDDGLLVPVVHDADRLTLPELARRVDELATGARARTLAPEQLTGGTVTVSNFGSNGTWLGTPIIRPPEVALIGFGRIRDAVVAVDGDPAVRPVLPVVGAADHRLNDGSHLAAFLDTLCGFAADPVTLLGRT